MTKDGRSHPDHSGPGGNGVLKIVTHAHGQISKTIIVQIPAYVNIETGNFSEKGQIPVGLPLKLSQHAYDGAPLHFIGHLQRNKVRQVVGAAALIHSVGSWPLLEEIQRQAERRELVQEVLLEAAAMRPRMARMFSAMLFIVSPSRRIDPPQR